MDKPKLAGISSRSRLEIFAAVFAAFYLIFMLFRFYHTYLMGEGWPIANPLFDPQFRFLDFYEINMAIHGLDPYISNLTNYPPLAILLALPFALVSDYSRFDSFGAALANDDPAIKTSILVMVVIFYVCILCATMFCIAVKNRIKDHHDYANGLLLFSLMAVSMPVLFAIDRGNYILFTVIFLVMWAVIEEEKPDSVWGAVFLALAAATKVYPVYLLLIYIAGRKWKKLAVAVFTGLVTTVIPLFFFHGTFIQNLKGLYRSLFEYGSSYRLYYNVGITGLVGYLFRIAGEDPHPAVIKAVWLMSGAILTLLVVFIFFFEKTTWKKVLLAVSLMVFLTPNSALYNSCYLIAPILIMIMGDNEFSKKDIPYLIAAAILMVPFAYSYLPNVENCGFYNEMNTAVLVDGLLYLAIIVYYIITGLPSVIRSRKTNASKQPA